MKKVVTWGSPKIASAKKAAGSYGSYAEFLAKSNAIHAEQELANEYLSKAMPALVALLDYKLRNHEPLIVMRPLRYQTSDVAKADPVDDAFYNNSKRSSQGEAKYTDVIRTILPGTQLMLKSLDMTLQEFVFNDAMGNEHAISFVDRNALMTQTSIFEEVRSFLETKGE
jgi:hypothetical protein